MTDKIRRVAHFHDEKLERQFDEIIRHSDAVKEDIDRVKRDSGASDLPKPEKPDAGFEKPTGLTVTPAFKRMILNWNINLAEDIYYYQIQFAISHVESYEWEPWQTVVEPVKVHFWVHENLDFNYEYQYRVRAVARDGRYSQWTDVVIGGQPGQISLSEEVAGELIGDYIADGTLPEDAFHNDVVEKYVHLEDDTANLSIIAKTPDEISSTVVEVYDGTGIEGSTIQQNSEAIDLRVMALDEYGNPTSVNAQIRVSQVDGDGFIYLEGDQITLNGATNIVGNLEVAGHSIVDGVIVGGEINIGKGNFVVDSQGKLTIGSPDPHFVITPEGQVTISTMNEDITSNDNQHSGRYETLRNYENLPAPGYTWNSVLNTSNSWTAEMDLTNVWGAIRLENKWKNFLTERDNMSAEIDNKTVDDQDWNNYYAALDNLKNEIEGLQDRIGITYTDKEFDKIGGMAYEDAVEKAKLGETIIQGGYIATDLLTADNIATGTLDAGVVNVVNINADHITAGTADFGEFSVTNFSADFIEAGTLSADFLSAGTIDAYEINVVNLSASNIVTGIMKAGSIDASEAYVYNLSASEIETGILDAIEVKGVYGTFSDYLSAANNEIQLIQGATGGVIQIRNDYNEIIAHLGNRREVAASEENDDRGALVLSDEGGVGKASLSIGTSDNGRILLGNSEVSADPLSASESLWIRGGTATVGGRITTRTSYEDGQNLSVRIDDYYDSGRVIAYKNGSPTDAAKLYGNYIGTGNSRIMADEGDFDTMINPIAYKSDDGEELEIYMQDLPTSKPTEAGRLWNDNGTLKVS